MDYEASKAGVFDTKDCPEGSIGHAISLAKTDSYSNVVAVRYHTDIQGYKCDKFIDWLHKQKTDDWKTIVSAMCLLLQSLVKENRYKGYNRSIALAGLKDIAKNCNKLMVDIPKKLRTEEQNAYNKSLSDFIKYINTAIEQYHDNYDLCIIVKGVEHKRVRLGIQESNHLNSYLGKYDDLNEASRRLKIDFLQIFLDILQVCSDESSAYKLNYMIHELRDKNNCSKTYINDLQHRIKTYAGMSLDPYADEMFSTIMSFIEDDVLTKACKA